MKKTNHIRLLGSHTIDHTVVLVSQILKALVEHSDVSEWRDFELSVRSKFYSRKLGRTQRGREYNGNCDKSTNRDLPLRTTASIFLLQQVMYVKKLLDNVNKLQSGIVFI